MKANKPETGKDAKHKWQLTSSTPELKSTAHSNDARLQTHSRGFQPIMILILLEVILSKHITFENDLIYNL